MINLQLKQWDGLCEFIEIEYAPGRFIRFCNAFLKRGVAQLSDTIVQWEGRSWPVRAANTEGWSKGIDEEERATITVADFKAVMFNLMKSTNTYSLAPIRRFQILASDILNADENSVISYEEFMINTLSSNGMVTTIELTDDIYGPRVEFPSQTMTEGDFPGMSQNYD